MKTRAMRKVAARDTADRLRVSLWFTPAVMAVIAFPLAWAMYRVDLRLPNDVLANSRLIISGGVVEVRGFLFSMATTILATAGIVFTLLTLPLSTVASQYGSRLLRIFLGDRTTQYVLGMFVAAFVYCLAAAMSIPPIEVQPDAPQVTLSVGLLLMLIAFGSLVLLVQHISTMLQAPNIAAAAGAELLDLVSIDTSSRGSGTDDQRQLNQSIAMTPSEADSHAIRVNDTGYVQLIDPEYMIALAQENNLVIRLLHKPGHFVWHDQVVALVWPAVQVGDKLENQIRRAFRIGNQRTPTQDVECAINQLVEMAVRAMSPAINDPFTAMTCLDYLGNGLALFVKQGEEDSNHYDLEGRLRLIIEPITFEEIVVAAFEMLRHASCDNARVLLHMLDTIAAIGRATASPAVRRQLQGQVKIILAESRAGDLVEEDRHRIQARGDALQALLNGAP